MNQILVSKRIYVTKEMKKKQKFYKFISILSLVTIISLLVYYIFAEINRNQKESISHEILSELGSGMINNDEALVVSLVDDEDTNDETMEIDETEQNVSSVIKTKTGGKYNAEAVISYPKIGISYPVLSETSTALLKVSVNKYWGPNPNEVGNYCIVGHNYKNGKMFGKLSLSSIGDKVNLTDLSNKTITYSVYDKYVIDPTDVKCTSQLTNGKVEMTLITCTNFGKQRLVVKCRAD